VSPDNNTAGGACGECAKLQYNPGLRSAIATILQGELKRKELEKTQTMSGRPDYLCSLSVMGDRRTALKSARDAASFKLLNAQRKIARMAKALSVHKRLTMLHQQNDVPELRQTIGAALAHGCGSRQSVCWTIRGCARGQRVARVCGHG
jgi:hypothetical protein